MTNTEREICIEEAVRLDVFNRLEMTHACCRGKWSMTSEDRIEIRSQEGEKKTQLDLLMGACIKSRSSLSSGPLGYARTPVCDCLEEERSWPQLFYRVGQLELHWANWWAKARKILPVDMTLEDGPSQMCSGHRFAEIRAQILRQRGYGDMDFTGVVQQHFEEELRLEEVVQLHEAREPFLAEGIHLFLDAALLYTCVNHGCDPWGWLGVQLANDEGPNETDSHSSDQDEVGAKDMVEENI